MRQWWRYVGMALIGAFNVIVWWAAWWAAWSYTTSVIVRWTAWSYTTVDEGKASRVGESVGIIIVIFGALVAQALITVLFWIETLVFPYMMSTDRNRST